MLTQRERLAKLYRDGFPEDSAAYTDYFLSKMADENVVCHTQNGIPVAAAYIVGKPAHLFGRNSRLGYLSGVCTQTEYRGRGFAGIVIRCALQKMYELGYTYTALNPFDATYYHRYGFCDVSFAGKKRCTGGKIYESTRLTEGDLPLLAVLEEQMTANCDNYLLSTQSRMRDKWGEYAADGIEGTVLYRDGRPFAAYFAEENEITYYATADFAALTEAEPLRGKQIEDFTLRGKPYTQIRLLDVERAFAEYDYAACCDGEVVLQITDDCLAHNNGLFFLRIHAGKLAEFSREKAENGKEICLSVAQLGAVLYNGGLGLFPARKNIFVDKF